MMGPQTNMLEYKLQPKEPLPWSSYLNHLVGIGVIESQLSEGSTAGCLERDSILLYFPRA